MYSFELEKESEQDFLTATQPIIVYQYIYKEKSNYLTYVSIAAFSFIILLALQVFLVLLQGLIYLYQICKESFSRETTSQFKSKQKNSRYPYYFSVQIICYPRNDFKAPDQAIT